MNSNQSQELNHSFVSRFPRDVSNLVDLLRWRAGQTPERELYTFLDYGSAQREVLTYERLHLRAQAIGAWLQELGASGKRALVLCPQGREYIEAFFGCLYAGVIAVPAYPPRENRNIDRLYAIAKDARPVVVLATDAILSQIQAKLSQVPGFDKLPCQAVNSISDDYANAWQAADMAAASLAFLQYTSGSTAKPKGVMVSHGNLWHNEEMIQKAFSQTEDSVIVGWLPLFHDMGLIGNVLQPLYVGARCILFSPTAFLQRPVSWLEAISKYRGTTSGGPNFAYDLCVRKIRPDQIQNLDLSSWTVAFNGAEPISVETLDRFSATFAPCGFRRSAFHPCYGLAEATLLVSGKHALTQPPRVEAYQRSALEEGKALSISTQDQASRKLVGCGAAWLDQEIRIVEPDSLTECLPGRIGEIWVRGRSIAQGYWKNPESSNEVFNAQYAGSSHRYLRTGDLGFIHDGELFITGRLKDLIIIRGRNHYPQDIETTVGKCSPLLRPGEGAAFSIEVQGDEQLVVVYELIRDYQEQNLPKLLDSIRQVVAGEHELRLHAVVLIQPGTILKTSSGKIQRRGIKEAFQAKKLAVVLQWLSGESEQEVRDARPPVASLQDIEQWLAVAIADKAGLARAAVELDQPPSSYGMDSLADVELVHQVESVYGVSLPPGIFLGNSCISAVALDISKSIGRSTNSRHLLPLPRDSQKKFPLSAGQAALWFLHRLAPESAAYNVVGAARIQKADLAALQNAFHAIVGRHPILRSKFTVQDGLPVRIQDDSPFSVQVHDVSGRDDALLEQRIRHETHRPFDLERGPVLRVSLLSRSLHDHILLFVAHHIVMDFWSLCVLIKEIALFYNARVSGPEPAAPALEWHYADYVQWQAQELSGDSEQVLWKFWQTQLAGELPVLNMPADRPRPALQSFHGMSESASLSPKITARIQASARYHGVTVFTFLLAAYATLLYRYTGQEDLIVGSPTSGRTDRRFESLIGYFVNPVAIRIALNSKMEFGSLVEQVRLTVLGVLAHQQYPFASLVDHLQLERDPGFSPVFQTMFALQKAPAFADAALAGFALGEKDVHIQLGSLNLESVRIEQQISQFDLTMMVAEVTGRLVLSVQYNTGLFERDAITALLANFTVLIESIIGNPESTLADLSLLTASEKQQITESNQTEKDYPSRLIHHLFEAQVTQLGTQIALERGSRRWTYCELNERSNQIAHYLKKHGAGPEVPVAICMERSLEMVAVLLGILKAGGCYVPLDPQYPSSRLQFMLEDTRARLLLTEQQFLQLFSNVPVTTICLQEKWPEIEGENPGNPENAIGRENLAYVIYTSGSTGKPKGVAIAHSSAAAFVQWAREIFPPEELAGVLASTSICFDLSIFELFAPLCWGGTVILARNVLELEQLVAASQVTLINTVPSAFMELLRMKAIPHSVRTINLAGEALHANLVTQALAAPHVERVFNLYGPSEDTTYSTYIGLEQGNPLLSVPIGKPIANTQIYVLDDALQPVPVGVRGELYIGGLGLARGYLNRPDLTARSFVPNPFSSQPGARMYRTGDQVRLLRDGNLEFFGRLDQQVKIRGYRIELEEISSMLEQHQGVSQAVVVIREDEPGEKKLVAYVTGKPEVQALDLTGVRGYLKERLPDYMVPTAIVELGSLPLTPNGKIDRKALPQPAMNRLDREVAEPQTLEQQVLRGIWEQLLKIDRPGIYDNFFELGGHSLMATQLVSRIRDVFKIDLPLPAIFESPTIAGLSTRIKQETKSGAGIGYAPIEQVDRNVDLPLSYAQLRLWVLEQISPSSAYNVPVTLRMQGMLNQGAIEQALTEVIRRHEILRTFFPSTNGKPTQVIALPATVQLPLVDLTGLDQRHQEAEVRRMVAAECQHPFDLQRLPLIRFMLFRLGTEQHVMFCNMHHIVSDGWSVSVLVREISVLYQAFVQGKSSPLPDLSIQYVDYAVWQRQRLQGKFLHSEIEYWTNQLAGAPPVLQLAAESRPAVQTFNGACERIALPKSLMEALNALSREAGATLFMTLLAVFKTLLYRYSGRTDIIVGTNVAGRSTSAVESLIGFFVNMLVLRSQCSPRFGFREFLAQVRDMTLKAFSHQELPFEMLVEQLQPERNLSYPPLFQVVFSLQNAPASELELAGLTVTPEVPESRAAKYDLLLDLRETRHGLTGVLEYNTDLFDPSTALQIAQHYNNLLESIIDDPGRWLAELELLNKAEKSHLLGEWNNTRREYPQSSCIHQLFEQTAARMPDSPALTDQDRTLSYSELNDRAEQVADYLAGLGVSSGTLVGLCFDHSLEEIIALLGVLKAGAAYVPLDPEYPHSRISAMLRNAQASVVLTVRRFAGMFSNVGMTPVCLDDGWQEITRHDGAAFVRSLRNSNVGPDALAYIIYTSGSTGVPKGVAISHRSLVNYICWARDVYRLEEGLNFPLYSSLAFDLTVTSIFATLITGNQLVIYRQRGNESSLDRILDDDRIGILKLTPTHLSLIRDRDNTRSRIKRLIVGGEALTSKLCREINQSFGRTVEIFNEYGPTEATVGCMIHQFDPATDQRASIPIGRPAANTEIYVLDQWLNPVPKKVIGDLYIAGDGLAQGYLGRPELTAERFLPNPFQPGQRMYKTGDLANRLSHDVIDFLGRSDEQVKVHGYRIELGEIEATLRIHGQIAQAAVLLREDVPGDKRLVAYVVPAAGASLQTAELRRFAQERMPAFMTPSIFLVLDTLPMSSNGKVDRTLLPSPDGHRPSSEVGYVEPQTATEQALAGIWREVLRMDQIGINDNFFELGGQSILAIQIIQRVNAAFAINLPMRTIFEESTIASLALLIEETLILRLETASDADLVALPECKTDLVS